MLYIVPVKTKRSVAAFGFWARITSKPSALADKERRRRVFASLLEEKYESLCNATTLFP